MITAKRIPTALISIVAVLGIVSCGTDENDFDYTSGRTVAEARDNLVDTVRSLDARPENARYRREPTKKGCIGALSDNHGPPYKWEYNYWIEYTPERESFARTRMDELIANGWRRDSHTRDRWNTSYRLYGPDGVMVAVGIPKPEYITGDPETSRGINFGGVSECAKE